MDTGRRVQTIAACLNVVYHNIRMEGNVTSWFTELSPINLLTRLYSTWQTTEDSERSLREKQQETKTFE